jgi:hypothetical protein
MGNESVSRTPFTDSPMRLVVLDRVVSDRAEPFIDINARSALETLSLSGFLDRTLQPDN